MENEAEDAEEEPTHEPVNPSNEEHSATDIRVVQAEQPEQAEPQTREEPQEEHVDAPAVPKDKEERRPSAQFSETKSTPSAAGVVKASDSLKQPSIQGSQTSQHESKLGSVIRHSLDGSTTEKHASIVAANFRPDILTALIKVNMKTLTGRLSREWITDAEREAIVYYDDDEARTSYTNAQIKQKVEMCASFLRCNGVRKGDVVCNALDVSPERSVVNFGVIFCGAVLMDGQCIVDEGKSFWVPLKTANVKHLIVDPNDDASVAWQMVADDVKNSYADIERATLADAPQLEKIFKFRMQHLMQSEEAQKDKSGFELLDQHGATLVEVVNSSDPAIIFIRRTQTEGIYKLVMRNHISAIHLALRAKEMLNLTKDDVVYCDKSVSRLGGFELTYSVTGFTMVKTTLHGCPAQRVVRETWNVLEQEMCTVASLEPPMIVMLASHCEDLPSDHWQLRSIITSGQVKPYVMDAIGSVCSNVINCYSVIEAGLVSRLIVTEETKTRFSQGCVGELSDPHRTRLDIHGIGAVKPSKIGEIVLRGKLVCTQYYNDPSLTQVSIGADGYLRTGDLGFYDSLPGSPFHEMLFVLGRKSEAIIRGDTAIFPKEIEEKVNQCPGIWKVSIVSIRDEKGIIQMCACVIPRSQDSVTIERVKEFCRYMLGGTADEDDNPHMPTYVFFFTDFPMMGNEVDKHTLAHTTAAVISGSEHIVL